jgi:nitrous oxidase accessory protein
MLDEDRGKLLELPFNVTVAEISAGPQTVFTCERIIVDFIGASGRAGDWIGMYQNDSGSLVSRQMLGSRESGNIAFSNPDPGSYFFNMHFEGDESVKASSGGVEVRENFGKKVTAEPSSVPPGGQVTVTYWGAPPSGTGVVGMYGMTRPDKFDLGKRPAGSGSCGSMVWTLPTTPGTYDFRLFEDDINRNLLAQSNSVTVS